MQAEFFNNNIDNPAILIPHIVKENKSKYTAEAYEQYNPKNHAVNNKAKRRDKLVYYPSPDGAKYTTGSAKGEPVLLTKFEAVNRLAMPFQKLITSRANAFVTAGGMILKAKQKTAEEKKLFEILNDTNRRNKLDFKNPVIVESVFSETECAEIWWTKKYPDNTYELRCNVYKASDGYKLMPVFDQHRDLIAFGLGYTSELEGRKIEHMDIYTKDELRKHTKSYRGQWELVPARLADDPNGEFLNPVKLPYKKIPVIYYSTPVSVWEDVQPMIDRYETLISNFADTVDYNGSPILLASGKILGFSQKGEQGKLIEAEEGADLKYVSSDAVPETVKLELETLISNIFTCCQTPNFSFDVMVKLGDISGEAWDRMLIDPHLMAKRVQNGWYGEGVQRRLNFLVTAIAELYPGTKGAGNLEVLPKFGLFRINSEKEKVELAKSANGDKPVATLKQSVEIAGLTDEIDETVAALEAEAAAAKPIIDPNAPDPKQPAPPKEEKK